MATLHYIEVTGEGIVGDMRPTFILSVFYCVELDKQLNWPEQERMQNQQIVQSMIRAGESILIMAIEESSNMPIGMIVYTKTTNPQIRRIEALFVGEQYRKFGIGKELLGLARGSCDLHTYATPQSVSWYEKNGFRKIREHEGTTEMTTSSSNPNYEFTRIIPLLKPYRSK